MTAFQDSGEELRELAFAALDLAVEGAAPGPLLPFGLGETAEGRSLQRCVADALEDALAGGRQLLAGLGPEVVRAAIAYDGYLTRDGQRTDAVYVEAHERGQEASLVLAQRYLPGEESVELVGNPADVGDAPPLLGDAPEPRRRGLSRR